MVVWSVIENHRGGITYRVREPSLEVVEPGIVARGGSDGPQYLVFAVNAREGDPPFFLPWHYLFNTQGGVVPILEGERLGTGASGPFAAPEHGLELADVRAATQAVDDE